MEWKQVQTAEGDGRRSREWMEIFVWEAWFVVCEFVCVCVCVCVHVSK